MSQTAELSSKQARYSRRKQSEEADITDLPPVENFRRRQLCGMDPGLFAFWYFPEGIGQGCLSVDHFDVMDTMATCFTTGGQYAQAIFRGFIKTTTAETVALWALLYGHKHFLAWLGSEGDIADESIDAITKELEENDLLLADFPEVCVPVRALEHKHQRCNSQTFRGERTHIKLKAGVLVFPAITLDPREAADLQIPIDSRGYPLNACARLDACGILSFKRGRKHNRADGRIQRIDAVVIDDFQTDLSASSPADTTRRLNVIRKSVLRSSSHREAMAAIVNGTIINRGDGMQQVMDRKLFPRFRQRTVPMMKSLPSPEALKLWHGDYARRIKDFDSEDESSQKTAFREATAIYEAHRQQMDHQAQATWHRAFTPDMYEISAIQHAMNIAILEGEDVFGAECQQVPKDETATDAALRKETIQDKANTLERGRVPGWANTLTAFIDQQKRALYWMVCGWGAGFKGHVIDYGIFPDQLSGSLFYSDVKTSLTDRYPAAGPEGAMRAAVNELSNAILMREFQREDGVRLGVARLGLDVGDGAYTSLHYETILRHPRKTQFVPTMGRYVGAKQAAWAEFKEKAGEEISRQYHYKINPTEGSKTLRLLQFDTNWWKSFMQARLSVADGDDSSLSLFGSPVDHQQLIVNLLSEYAIEVTAKNRKVMEWQIRPGQKENHLLDCLVGCGVLAASTGIQLAAITPVKTEQRRVFTVPAMARRR